MRAHIRSRTWLCLLLLCFVVLLGWPGVQRASSIKAIEDAIDRDWEISFDRSGGRPALLPAFLDSGVKAWLDWRYAHSAGYSGGDLPKTRNRGEVYHQRFCALFRGPIELIDIGYPENFRAEELGAALARFPKLRRFCIFENEETGPSEAEWTLLCRRLRELPQLEAIELGGYWLSDSAIAPLAGHPGLREVTILDGCLSPECTKTFAAMPKLSKLHIEGQRCEGDTWLTPEEEKMVRAALPAVTIEVP